MSTRAASNRLLLLLVAIALLAGAGSAASMDGRRIAIAAIHGYQRRLAPVAAAAGARCRFTPTCSRYAEIVIRRDGVIRGGWRAVKRIARCGPWTPMGTRDEP